MTLKFNFGNRKKLVPTQKPTQMFGLKFGMQGLSNGALVGFVQVLIGLSELVVLISHKCRNVIRIS